MFRCVKATTFALEDVKATERLLGMEMHPKFTAQYVEVINRYNS